MDAFLKPAVASPLQTIFNSNVAKNKVTTTKGKSKDGDVERIYQKKTQLEHILLRPDTYIGSVETVTEAMWIYDPEASKMIKRDITYVPGLFKIFDEILVNAADNKQRDKSMDCIKVDIDAENNVISVYNNGKGIPVVVHKDENLYVPTMIFGHLLTSSNYNDDEKKVTGGRNGYGAKLCNIFSTKFTVETSSKEYKSSFKQTWTDNMSKKTEAKVKSASGADFTRITFSPDLKKFKMESLDNDTVSLLSRRAYDIAGSSKGVKVYLNGKRLPIKGFSDYVEQYTKEITDDQKLPLKVVYEAVNSRWEVAVTLSEGGFQQVSFVNSIATTKGGRHVDYVTDHIVAKLQESIKKKNKAGLTIRPHQIKTHLWVFVNCLIENPTFDSQTKENMTLQAKNFGSKCVFSDKFITQVQKCGVIESIVTWMKYKQQTQLDAKCSKSKHSKLRGVPKLEDANNAGTKSSANCTLILTEGDSAKSLAVSGLGVVGRDKYGVFPLRGKLLNVREATHKQILENAEINNLIKILGLQYKKKYQTVDDLKTLRYGRLMIMTDQDQDGSHIKGLIINFIHHNWPELLRLPFLEEFITPIVKVTKGGVSKSFYSIPEFEEWKGDTNDYHTWRTKYYKGLGTSTPKEAKEYFADMERHRIKFKYTGQIDDESVQLAFSKKKIEERKDWLTEGLEIRKQRREQGLPELYLYEKNTKAVSYEDFVNKELILFSNMDNERSIPSLIDGLKPGQRKVLFTCLKRNIRKEIKVSELAGSVSEQSAYHHGDASLLSTIVNLAQNFVGSNNINILLPIGQFGTRLQGGKDAASPRYIFTSLSPLTRHIFNIKDDSILHYLTDDNKKIEPDFYMPIIPMVLVNGADGIGTGWMTKVPNYNPRQIVANIKHLLAGEPLEEMEPWFKNFVGTVEQYDTHRFVTNGEVSIIDEQNIEITELPIRTWTQQYKESVLETLLYGNEKSQPSITNYKEYNTDTTVRFVVSMSADTLAKAEREGLHTFFKLQASFSTGSMVLFDRNGCLKRYNSVNDIFNEFFEVRMDYYFKRKAFMVGMLKAESSKLSNQARFVLEKIDGIIIIENRKKVDVVKQLSDRGFDSDPVKTWKNMQKEDESDDEDSDSEVENKQDEGTDYSYLLAMSLLSLTKEKKEELLKQRDQTLEELRELESKTPSDLWREDLDAFVEELDVVEAKEREDEAAGNEVGKPAKKGKLTARKKPLKMLKEETQPSPHGRRVQPRLDVVKRKAVKAAATKTTSGVKRTRKIAAVGEESAAKIKKTDDSTLTSESDEILPLTERLKKSAASKTPTVKKGLKQSTLSFTRKAVSKKSKDDSILSDNSFEDKVSTEESESQRNSERPTKRAATKKRPLYALDSTCESIESLSDDEDEADKKSGSGSSGTNKKTSSENTQSDDKPSSHKSRANKESSASTCDDEDEKSSDDSATEYEKTGRKTVKQKSSIEENEKKAKKRGHEDSSDDDYMPEIKTSRKQIATRGRARGTTRAKKVISPASDSDSNVIVRPKTTRPRAKYVYSDSDE